MQTRVAVVIAFLGFAACRVVDPPPPPDAPRITAFTTDKSRIASGESATLTFTTTGASKVSITDDRGGSVEIQGEAASGTATVAPRNSAFYVLRAVGEGGSDTAFVQIAVNEPLKDVFLLAVPSTVTAGQSAQLLWGAAGASSVALSTNGGTPQTLVGTTGVVNVTPARSSEYLLAAQGAPGTPSPTALARIAVTPRVTEFKFEAPGGTRPDEVINFTWASAGASQIEISERTFGVLTTITDPTAVDLGAFSYTLPAKLPNGFDVVDGLALYFTITATSGDESQSRTLATTVGELPVIDFLRVPEAVSAGGRVTISWRTLNASRITVLAGGQRVFETLPSEMARVASGSVELPAPAAQSDYTIIAVSPNGLEARQLRTVRVVSQPTIDTFTLTPTVASGGDLATATWTTTNATRVSLRVENGATIGEITAPSMVRSGSTTIKPLQSLTIVLEAANQAGDTVRKTQSVRVVNGLVEIAPSPLIRGDTATLSWLLSALGATEVVGLATPTIEAIPGSTNFVDISTMVGAEELFFTDTSDGSALIPLPRDFEFRFLGDRREQIYASVNGFLAWAAPGALGTNGDLTASGTAAVVAPFWDNLELGVDSRVFYALQTRAGTNEKYLVVQWDKVQLSADALSSLTFQVHLYETGQISFHYDTMSGAVNSATVGIKDTVRALNRSFVYNGTPASAVVAQGLELNFFNALPADGMIDFVATSATPVVFYARTSNGVLPASVTPRVFGVGDVAVTEAMPLPDLSTGSVGQWFELRNNTTNALDFGGLVVSSLGSLDGGFTIPVGTNVDAGSYLVLGQSTDQLANGGVPVALVYDDVPLSVPDSLKVTVAATTIGSLAWDAGVQSASILDRDRSLLYASGGGAATCMRMLTYGSTGAFGTPGLANESCAPYTVSSIPGAFTPAPASATLGMTEVGTTFTALDEGYAVVPLPTPFTYFGMPYSSLTVVSNGFITFSSTITTDAFLGNPTTPATTAPNGVVAPFWDDLDENAGTKVAAWRATDRFIVSWESYEPFLNGGVLDFQAHLLDTGVIEFHYGTMAPASSSSQARYNGNSATVWLEAPDGTYAVPYSVNTASLSANSGVRFTPR